MLAFISILMITIISIVAYNDQFKSQKNKKILILMLSIALAVISLINEIRMKRQGELNDNIDDKYKKQLQNTIQEMDKKLSKIYTNLDIIRSTTNDSVSKKELNAILANISVEICDGKDNDQDGLIDEGDVCK